MLACVDVSYRPERAISACVTFADWRDETPIAEWTVVVAAAAPYEPGAFYRRELPAIRAALAAAPGPLRVVVVDGYVWLGAAPGLGAHLHAALGETTPVVGVAKSGFRGAPGVPVVRGRSSRPLWVTAAGVDTAVAASWIAEMHGRFRVPTLLQRADRLCRTAR